MSTRRTHFDLGLRKQTGYLTKQAEEQPNERWHLVPMLKEAAAILEVEEALEKHAGSENSTFLDYYVMYFRGSVWPTMHKHLTKMSGVKKVNPRLQGTDGIYKFDFLMDTGQRFEVQCNVEPKANGFATFEMFVDGRFHVNTLTSKYMSKSQHIASYLVQNLFGTITNIMAVQDENRRLHG